MSPSRIAMLLLYAIGIAAGQVLFKIAAGRPAATGASGLFQLATNLWFVAAALLYAGLSVYWVWLLRQVPLGLAYPFVALSFVLTLVAAVVLFGERAGPRQTIGALLIVGGIVLVAA